ncbi:hypothetical protein PRZ48_007827 [Zasmidium cellare]|uniref:6-phosphogluconate dehydrogenase n=1 Tax=Zasmidium cellare TaxID=395010 RepID=A0ABR0EL73_ZASCE|nr:hypothetical protein PRZ48_007827 [Zasmidium cellare]
MGVRVAWIGLGNMGGGMARNLINKGNLGSPLVLYNRTISRADALCNEVGHTKATVVASIVEAVERADLIFTSLSNDDALKDAMEQALQIDVAGKKFVDCSTVHPDVANNVAARVANNGADFVAMPAIDFVKPYITGVIGRRAIEFRDEPVGKAQILKLIANMFILSVNEIVAEGMTFAEKASVDPNKLLELLSVLFGGPYTVYGARMVGGDYHKKEVPVEIALKDARHALHIAEDVGCAIPSLDAAAKNLEAVKDQRGPTADSSSVYGLSRTRNGLSLEN